MTSHKEIIEAYLSSSSVVIVDDENETECTTQIAERGGSNAPSHSLITRTPENSGFTEIVPLKKLRKGARGPSSFSLPRVVVDALIDQKASAHQICAMLVIACFTGPDGMYSTAGISAVSRYTGANKTKGGSLNRAIQGLFCMHVYKEVQISKRKRKKIDLGPVLHDAESWFKNSGIEPPKPAHPRAVAKFVIERFQEMDTERVWFSSNLVLGFGAFKKPLQQLLESGSGDVARLLLLMYAMQDMPGWGGVIPYSQGHSQLNEGVVTSVYEPEPAYCEDFEGGARVVVARKVGGWHVNPNACQRVLEECESECSAHLFKSVNVFRRALDELIHSGFVYEVVTVLNKKFVTPQCIPESASPIHELASLSPHGFTNRNEHGVGWATQITCEELDASLLDEDGDIEGRYAAIVRNTIDVMVVGIIRIRFRVASAKSNTVAAEVASRLEKNTRAFDYINRIRLKNGLDELMGSDCKVPSMM